MTDTIDMFGMHWFEELNLTVKLPHPTNNSKKFSLEFGDEPLIFQFQILNDDLLIALQVNERLTSFIREIVSENKGLLTINMNLIRKYNDEY